jgi:putative Mn2+ efflux pump MntP
MELVTYSIIAVGLAMDAFAVSLGIGTTGQAKDGRAVFRLSFHFGFFQGFMTLLGWLLGSSVANLIANFDHWVAFALLAWVGGRMIKEGLTRGGEEACPSRDPSRGRTLMVLCVATSIDAMAVGVTLALIGADIATTAVAIGAATFLMTALGTYGARWIGPLFGRAAEGAGGLCLVAIGTIILFEHLSA